MLPMHVSMLPMHVLTLLCAGVCEKVAGALRAARDTGAGSGGPGQDAHSAAGGGDRVHAPQHPYASPGIQLTCFLVLILAARFMHGAADILSIESFSTAPGMLRPRCELADALNDASPGCNDMHGCFCSVQ